MLILALPWLLIVLALLAIVLAWKKKWLYAITVLIAIIVLNVWSECVSFGSKNTFKGDIKVFCLNVNGDGEYDEEKVDYIASLIIKENSDVVFITENFPPLRDSLTAILHEWYPYDTRYVAHNLFFSKYPLRNQVFYERPNGGSGYIVKAHITISGNELCLFGCHLSSNNYSSKLDYLTPDEIDNADKIRSYLTQINYASCLRELEADTVVSSISESDCAIVMGDMNDICGSVCMRKFNNAGLKDAWSEGGFGYGATIHTPLPYRIDHILYNEGLVLKGVKVIDTSDISDHNALVAEFDFSN